MKKVLPLKRWKKKEPPDRESFSDEDSDEEDSDYEEIVIPKNKQANEKAQRERSLKFETHQTEPKPPNAHPKEISSARNAKQPSAIKAAPGINRTARYTLRRASVKVIETEGLMHPFSKIIREGTNCISLWPM